MTWRNTTESKKKNSDNVPCPLLIGHADHRFLKKLFFLAGLIWPPKCMKKNSWTRKTCRDLFHASLVFDLQHSKRKPKYLFKIHPGVRPNLSNYPVSLHKNFRCFRGQAIVIMSLMNSMSAMIYQKCYLFSQCTSLVDDIRHQRSLHQTSPVFSADVGGAHSLVVRLQGKEQITTDGRFAGFVILMYRLDPFTFFLNK